MKACQMELSQMLEKHPILLKKEEYKRKYIYVLEYFVKKYSVSDIWADSMLRLYKGKLSDKSEYPVYPEDLDKPLKELISTRLGSVNFFPYRYSLLIDSIFICAYEDREKSERILAEILTLYQERHHDRLRKLFDFLFNETISIDNIGKANYLKECFNKNRDFLKAEPIKVLVTATMSAGKSTLLNALIGKKVNRTQSDSCTSKIHYIKNKPFEDTFCYELDHELELNADYQTLMDDNRDNHGNEIVVGTYFRMSEKPAKRIWFIDTPGVNFVKGEQHKNLTEEAIKSIDVDLLIFVMNGENIGTEDEGVHLRFVHDNYQGKVVFVINKMDNYRKNDDSVEKTINDAKEDLIKIGFVDPVVVPISSYVGYLSKMKIYNEPLDEDELDELDIKVRKLKNPEYQFNTYYPEEIQNEISMNSKENIPLALIHSGIPQLEQIIYDLR